MIWVGIAMLVIGGWMITQNTKTVFGGPLATAGAALIIIKLML